MSTCPSCGVPLHVPNPDCPWPLPAPSPPVAKKRTRIGLIGAFDKACWAAIDEGRDAVLLYVRTGKPDIKVTIEVQRLDAPRDTQVILEGEDV
jgi:hypothetical protein